MRRRRPEFVKEEIPEGYMVFPFPGPRNGKVLPIAEVERVAKGHIEELNRMIHMRWKYDPTYFKIKLRKVED